MFRVAYNGTDRPVLIDAHGRQLDGLAFGAVDDEAPEVIAALASEHLTVYDAPFGDDAREDALAAQASAVALQRRLELYQGASDADLVKAAAKAELEVPDDGERDGLVLDLVRHPADPVDLLPSRRKPDTAPKLPAED